MMKTSWMSMPSVYEQSLPSVYEQSLWIAGCFSCLLGPVSTAIVTNKKLGVQVKGKRLDVESGIRTRSVAKQQEERWEYVPAPAKIFSLLADTLVEAKEGGTLVCL